MYNVPCDMHCNGMVCDDGEEYEIRECMVWVHGPFLTPPPLPHLLPPCSNPSPPNSLTPDQASPYSTFYLIHSLYPNSQYYAHSHTAAPHPPEARKRDLIRHR